MFEMHMGDLILRTMSVDSRLWELRELPQQQTHFTGMSAADFF